ncbi:MAG: flagellar basal body L-ring protein FlgH [Acidobacteriota bacterium]
MSKWLTFAVLVVAAASGGTAHAAGSDKRGKEQEKAASKAASDNYDELFARYLNSARTQPVTVSPNPASWINSLMSDPRARHVNDLVTVNVIESITASGTADSSVSKSSAAAIGLPNLFGLETKLPSAMNPASLVSGKQDTSFKGAGSTTRAGQLSAVMTARVAEVLPNGDLVIEGVHEIEINGDRQIIVLTGVARVTDITPGNVVASTSLGQLQIRYFGRGLMKDSLSPGWLVRVLNKVF